TSLHEPGSLPMLPRSSLESRTPCASSSTCIRPNPRDPRRTAASLAVVGAAWIGVMATSACRPPVAPPPLPGSDETTPTSAPSDPHLVQASSASPPADCLAGYPDRPQTIVGPPSLHGAHKLSVVPAYMDDDAWPDLVVTTGGHDAKGHVYVLFGPFHGKSEPVPAWVSTVSDHFAGLAVGDIDGDGRLDLATATV